MRVNNIISEYKKNNDMAFFYNEIVDMNGRKLMPKLPDIVYGCEDIGEYNFLGMSNTAVNLNKLDIKFIESLNEYKYDIFDWYFYTRILLLGLKGKKVDEIIELLKGIPCGMKGTSCPDQIAIALQEYKEKYGI